VGSQKNILLIHKLIEKFQKYGLIGFLKMCVLLTHRFLYRKYYLFFNSKAERFQNPSADELSIIECDLHALGIPVEGYEPDPGQFQLFLREAMVSEILSWWQRGWSLE
jgi:hypothetical protein